MQRPLDTFGIARNDREICLSWLIRLRAALFPIPQSAKRDEVAHGKFLLGKRERAAKGFNTGYAAQLPGARVGERRVITVAGSGSFDFRSTPAGHGWGAELFFGAVRFDPEKPAVTSHSRDSRGLAHFLSRSGRR